MVHTVALIGANGTIGSLIVPHLVKAHHDGTIKVVLLVRPGGNVKNVDSREVEVREVDLEDGESLDRALKGVNVVLTALGMDGMPLVIKVLDTMKRSPDGVTLIPSRFGTTWNPDDFQKIPSLKGISEMQCSAEKHAVDIGVGITTVLAGLFHNWFFDEATVGVDVKANTVEVNKEQLKNPFPITNTDDLAAGLADLVLRDPESIKDKHFSIVSHWVTGEQMVDTLTKMHGKRPEVSDYDEAAEDALIDSGPFGPPAAGYKRNWTNGPKSFGYENELTVSGRSFEQTARDFLAGKS